MMSKEETKELFDKYGVKDLKEKNGQSECYCCKNIKHKYSLTWTSFLYEYKEKYYCYDCLLSILLQQELTDYKERNEKALEQLEIVIKHYEELINEKYNQETSVFVNETCKKGYIFNVISYLDLIKLEILDKKEVQDE